MRYAPLLLLLLTACGTVKETLTPDVWGRVTRPTEGPAHIYGAYYKGCLAGAQRLPDRGPGYLASNETKGHYYAHPFMLSYLSALGLQLESQGRSMVVADIAQPRGGPIKGGHGSHQIGLDVDIWYMPSRVKAVQNERLDPTAAALLQQAASFDEVDRIFVAAPIKKALCVNHSHEPWMEKVRPWWGHERHFHVRLKCPPGESDCVGQPPVNTGDGCDLSLQWWFGYDAGKPGAQADASANTKKITRMPAACDTVLNAP